jgi:hypothetical protein
MINDERPGDTGAMSRGVESGQVLASRISQGTAYDRLLDRLRTDSRKVITSARGAMAQCPAHEDRNPSLSITKIPQQVLLHCFAGCQTADVLAALGWTMADLFDDHRGAKYHYLDPAGQIIRTVSRTPDKRFPQNGQTKGPSTLYRLPEVVAAVAAGQMIFLVEGEKDADALVSIGAVATTAPMGAGNFAKVDTAPLTGAKIIAVVDHDPGGQTWAGQVRDSVAGVAGSLIFQQAKIGKDAADHVAAGLGLDDLVEIEISEAKSGRRARVTWADKIMPEPVVWGWRDESGGRIPAGSLSVAAGREGSGKSCFAVWLTAHVTRGTLPGSLRGSPRRVLYAAIEDSWRHTIVPRLLAADADLSMVGRFDVITDEDQETAVTLPADMALLGQVIRDHDVALVVLDPLLSTVSGTIDSHKEREVRLALDPLARLADDTGAVILGIAHFNKSAGSDAANLITGSGAFKNVPRSVFGFARDHSDENAGRIMSQVKNSLGRDDLPSLSYRIEAAYIATEAGPAETARLIFTGHSERTVADVLRDRDGSDEDHDDRRELDRWLIDYLTSDGGSANARDVIRDGRASGFNENAIKKARRRVGAASERRGFGRGSSVVWTIDAAIGAIGARKQRPESMAPMSTYEPSASALPSCSVCGFPLDPVLAAEGHTTHPACDGPS